MQKRITKNYEKLIRDYYYIVSKNKKIDDDKQPKIEATESIMITFENEAEAAERMLTRLKAYDKAIRHVIHTDEINKIGLRSREIAELVDAGMLERVKQGHYRIVAISQEDSEAELIAELYPDGIICMTTALFYYGYSDRTPLTWDIAIDRNVSKARFNIDYPYVKPHYIEKMHLTYGIAEARYEGCVLQIFDRDRLICECIKHENKMDREIFNKAIQGYINDSKKNVVNLMEYAKKRNIHKKVRERISVWL